VGVDIVPLFPNWQARMIASPEVVDSAREVS